jgi:ribosome maturation protein SDO1
MIEKAMHDIHYSITKQSSKQQALDVIKQIQAADLMPIEQAKLRIKVCISGNNSKKIKEKLSSLFETVEEENWNEDAYECVSGSFVHLYKADLSSGAWKIQGYQ